MAPTTSGRWTQIRERRLSTPELEAQYERRKRAVVLTREFLLRIDAERERAGLTRAQLA